MDDVEIIEINEDNITEHSLCFYKNPKVEGYKIKCEWLKNRFLEGLRYKILYSKNDGDVGTIEYIEGEKAWRAINAQDHMVIHCVFIEKKPYKGKGYGKLLIKEAIEDAKRSKLKGVTVLTRKGTWMVGKDVFLKMGFNVVDTAPPDYELMALTFKKTDSNPQLKRDFENKIGKYKKGLTMIVSDQCPYTAKAIADITEVAQKDYKIKPNLIKLKNAKEAQNAPVLISSFNLILDGELVADHPISATRFKNIMKKKMDH
jgi:predicted GNAT family acetyltransferase